MLTRYKKNHNHEAEPVPAWVASVYFSPLGGVLLLSALFGLAFPGAFNFCSIQERFKPLKLSQPVVRELLAP